MKEFEKGAKREDERKSTREKDGEKEGGPIRY